MIKFSFLEWMVLDDSIEIYRRKHRKDHSEKQNTEIQFREIYYSEKRLLSSLK